MPTGLPCPYPKYNNLGSILAGSFPFSPASFDLLTVVFLGMPMVASAAGFPTFLDVLLPPLGILLEAGFPVSTVVVLAVFENLVQVCLPIGFNLGELLFPMLKVILPVIFFLALAF